MNDTRVGGVSRHGPFPGRLDPERIAAYAAATGDRTTAVLAGDAVPPIFPVILAFDAQDAANADLPPAVWQLAAGGVHGEHDVVLHRPLTPNEPLDTWSRLCGVRMTRAGTQVVLHLEQFDAGGVLVVEQWWTTVLFGIAGLENTGSAPADHRFPESARDAPIGSATQHVDGQTARRYAEVSGDWSAHHFDLDVARATGVDFLFAHGLCTMAICSHLLLGILGIADPGRIRRVAVRFASPTRMDADLTASAYGIDDTAIAFEATCAGAVVITHGRLELRP